jgi:hypothetical protein
VGVKWNASGLVGGFICRLVYKSACIETRVDPSIS